MAYPMNERLAFGTLTKADLLADSSNLLRNFPYATYPYKWMLAYDRIATPYAWREADPDGVVQGFGGMTFEASFGLLNDAMLEYLMDQFPAGVDTADVTIYIYGRLPPAGWKAINCKMTLPEQTAEGLGGVHDIYFHEAKFTFFSGRIADEA